MASLVSLYGLTFGTDIKAASVFCSISLGLFLSLDVATVVLLFELLNLPLLSMLWSNVEAGLKGILYATYLLVLYGLLSGTLLVLGLWFDSGILLGVALGAKLALVPFHVWLGKVHTECSTLGSVLLASLALKVGYYVGCLYSSLVLPVACGCATAFLGGLMLVQLGLLDAVDAKRFIALFSVAHMQVLMILRSAGCSSSSLSDLVTVGMLAHSLVSAGLFFLVGRLTEALGTRSLHEVSLCWTALPNMVLLLVASNVAFPSSSLFLVELIGHSSLLSSGSLMLVAVTISFTSLSLVACFLSLGRTLNSSVSASLLGTVDSLLLSCTAWSSWLAFLLLV